MTDTYATRAEFRKLESKVAELEGKLAKSFRWKPYGAYMDYELRVLEFPSHVQRDKAVDLCWNDPYLKGMPHTSADGETLVVPEGSIFYLRGKGIKFRAHKVQRT